MEDGAERARSRSPPKKAAKGGGGFRWKEKRPTNNDEDDRSHPSRRREYRNRSPPRHRDNNRDYDHRDNGRRDERDHYRDRRDRDRDQDRYRDRPRHDDREGDKGRDRGDRQELKKKDNSQKPGKKERKAPAQAAPTSGVEMIVVNINDRLGTKSAIPCLPSDTIGQLKLMVAARIGREAGQIMLKRQGERPFKDQLSLEDYGISNGVQLDLEIDTGD